MLFFTRLILRLIRVSNIFVFGAAAVFIFSTSLLAYRLEPDTFETLFNALWWVMTTVTTVGYGDFYPRTTAGKWLGMFLFIFGVSLLSITISKVIDALLVYQRKKEAGKLQYHGQNHFVIIAWSKHAELAILEILNTDPSAEVVLIDSAEKTPLTHDRVHYVQGNPVQEATLVMANLAKARAVFIFADEVTENHTVIRDTAFIDGKTLLVATAIERNYQHVHTIVEVKDEGNIRNFQHVKVDEFILGNETISHLAVRSAFNPGASKILSQLLTRRDEGDLFQINKNPQWTTYRDAFDDLLKQGATLIADGDNLGINQRLDDKIPDQAQLFVICDKAAYERLVSRRGSR
ncbi:potassium channel family protein [Paenibacillus xerothermodurans]|uniref:Ion transporter n=1 Tax=Paenibacillus xerothermodurans TaxID=1977292 RepID=A0A2W1P0E5_PAEXE|nr:potassium channel family protein [Paenibacillus xerothermodurans]PZE20548.1 ion transporter [Paenibacillus xerothermodurans]